MKSQHYLLKELFLCQVVIVTLEKSEDKIKKNYIIKYIQKKLKIAFSLDFSYASGDHFVLILVFGSVRRKFFFCYMLVLFIYATLINSAIL